MSSSRSTRSVRSTRGASVIRTITEDVDSLKGAYLEGSALIYGIRLVFGILITVLSLGLLYPLSLVYVYGWKVNRMVFDDGRRMKFTGTMKELFPAWVTWWLLFFASFVVTVTLLSDAPNVLTWLFIGAFGWFVYNKVSKWKLRQVRAIKTVRVKQRRQRQSFTSKTTQETTQEQSHVPELVIYGRKSTKPAMKQKAFSGEMVPRQANMMVRPLPSSGDAVLKSLLDGVIDITVEDFRRLWQDAKRSNLTGVAGIYILYNATNNRYYVGQSSQDILGRVNSHFTGRGNGDVYADYTRLGHEWYIRVIRLDSTPYKDLDSLERYAIEYYNAYTEGYNKTRGNGVNKISNFGRKVLNV